MAVATETPIEFVEHNDTIAMRELTRKLRNLIVLLKTKETDCAGKAKGSFDYYVGAAEGYYNAWLELEDLLGWPSD